MNCYSVVKQHGTHGKFSEPKPTQDDQNEQEKSDDDVLGQASHEPYLVPVVRNAEQSLDHS